MESSEVTWKVVSNTVANRMIDLSLIHKLIPSRRLRRRNRATNRAVKHFHGLKTYSQYIKIKTSVLRNLSDDRETDDNSSFTEDDYNILYKSDLSLAKYLTRMSMRNKDYFYYSEVEADKSDVASDTEDGKGVVKKLKSHSRVAVNLGWQKVLKKKDKSICYSAKKTKDGKLTRKNLISPPLADAQGCMEISDINNSTATSLEKNSLNLGSDVLENDKEHILEQMDVLCVQSTNEDQVMRKALTVEVDANGNNESVQIDSATKKTNERHRAQEDSSCKISNSVKTPMPNGIKRNSAHLLGNIKEAEDTNNSDTDRDCRSWQNARPDLGISETIRDEITNDKLCKIPPSIINSTHQQKDSGIEEDTEEELPEPGKRHYKKNKNKIQEAEENASTDPPILEYQDDSTGPNEHPRPKGYDLPSNTDSSDTTENLDKNRRQRNDCEAKIQKHKLQPKVTRTEIVNKKYKIVSCDDLMSNKYAESQQLHDERLHEEEEFEPHMEESISPLTKKRLQQLRRLNLTVDSDSSLSENEDTYHAIENTRDKLLERCKEYSELSCIKDEKETLIRSDKELSNGWNFKMEKRREANGLCLIERNREKLHNRKPLKSGTCWSDNGSHPLKDQFKINKYSFPDIERSSSVSDRILRHKSNLECEANHYFDHEKDKRDAKREHLTPESAIRHSNESAVGCGRPRNLQELIEEQEEGGHLTPETAPPTVTFKDMGEHELFIIDIPSTVLENQLEGKRIVLTEKKLKLGKQKYKIEYKNTDNVSCVFASGKSRKPYKTVNIKPAARVVVREKVSTTSTNNDVNGIREANQFEDSITSTKRYFQNGHSPTQRIRLNVAK